MNVTAGVAPFIVGGTCTVRYRPPADRRRVNRLRGTIVRITAHQVDIEHTIIVRSVRFHESDYERTVTVAVRLADIVGVDS